jgi:hypothetical protein
VFPVAVGAIALTLPVRSASTAAMLTSAACPTAILATSLSTTLAVTSNVSASIVMASPDGAVRPFEMLTAVTIPAIGALIVPRRIWSTMSARALLASEAWLFALLRAIFA